MNKDIVTITAKWIDRIYTERNFGRGVATIFACATGSAAWLCADEWIFTVFVIVASYLSVNIVADPIHDRITLARKRGHTKRRMKELFSNLGHEEISVLKGFVSVGGNVVTWRMFNKYPHFNRVGMDSLVHREMAHPSVGADLMTETFVLNEDLFGYAQSVLPEAKPPKSPFDDS